ncbi:putative extracellular membrane-like protein [Botryosphaeria dothidea]|uniref:Extracellular membrane-like protein n=1 Tax=Botryosphaeria dothidea TaxID=55169 RepID=A0A8H4ILC1_9PEZI|nr:putative extracellular membrane-like protein [Botryosphaeria dothidea]
MKVISAIAMAVMVSAAAAATQDDIPACAQPCIAKAAPQVGCDANDLKCKCDKADELSSKAAQCVFDSCNNDDVMKAAKVSKEVCQGQ